MTPHGALQLVSDPFLPLLTIVQPPFAFPKNEEREGKVSIALGAVLGGWGYGGCCMVVMGVVLGESLGEILDVILVVILGAVWWWCGVQMYAEMQMLTPLVRRARPSSCATASTSPLLLGPGGCLRGRAALRPPRHAQVPTQTLGVPHSGAGSEVVQGPYCAPNTRGSAGDNDRGQCREQCRGQSRGPYL